MGQGWATVELVGRCWLAAVDGPAGWQLWMARLLVSEVRLPGSIGDRMGWFTPGQVHRHFTGILLRLATAARAPRRREHPPGRQTGQHPNHALHYQVARRPPTASRLISQFLVQSSVFARESRNRLLPERRREGSPHRLPGVWNPCAFETLERLCLRTAVSSDLSAPVLC